jgi:hypothetical protein
MPDEEYQYELKEREADCDEPHMMRPKQNNIILYYARTSTHNIPLRETRELFSFITTVVGLAATNLGAMIA